MRKTGKDHIELGVQCQQDSDGEKNGQGSLVVFFKYRDPSLGMRVLAAGDKIGVVPVSEELHETCHEYWRKQVGAGQMTADRLGVLRQFLFTKWKLFDKQKVHHFHTPNKAHLQFALGFTGLVAIMNRFVAADKSGVENMQDVANVMHTAYTTYYSEKQKPLPRDGSAYYATNGQDIYELRVGQPGQKVARVQKLTGTGGTHPDNKVFADGFGARTMKDWMKQNLHGIFEGRLHQIVKLLTEGFRQVATLGLELSGRPMNSVSASWRGIDMGYDELNPLARTRWRPIGHIDAEEVHRVALIRHEQFTVERAIHDLVRAGEWNAHFKQKHPEYRKIWEKAECEAALQHVGFESSEQPGTSAGHIKNDDGMEVDQNEVVSSMDNENDDAGPSTSAKRMKRNE